MRRLARLTCALSAVALGADLQVGVLPRPAILSFHFYSEQSGWAHDHESLWQTETGGATWKPVRLPGDARGRVVVQVAIGNKRRGWLLTGEGLYLTEDGGQIWSRRQLPEVSGNTRIQAIWLSNDLVAGWAVGNRRGREEETPVLFRTQDSGKTWAAQEIPRTISGTVLQVYAADTSNAVVTLTADALHTSDGGQHWRGISVDSNCSHSRTFDAGRASPVRATFLDGGPQSVAFGGRSLVWISDDRGNLLHTRDGGATWCDRLDSRKSSAPNARRPLLQMQFLNEREGWAVDIRGRLMRTADGGRTWHAHGARATLINVLDATNVWYATGQELYKVRE